MIELYPNPPSRHSCPTDGALLRVTGWRMPGMRVLAQLVCPTCSRKYFGDLAVGHGLHTPKLVNAEGRVSPLEPGRWFADDLARAFADRRSTELKIETISHRPLVRPLVLNCLDNFYGHSILKLLNAQWYLDRPGELDLVCIVPSWLQWMVPTGVAELWVVDLPLREGGQWNDWLADEFARRLARFDRCLISVAVTHPASRDYDLERFTGVKPFDLKLWDMAIKKPKVALIWRDDARGAHEGGLLRVGRRISPKVAHAARRATQTRWLRSFAQALTTAWPTLELAITGIGAPEGAPHGVQDLRAPKPTADIERRWCALHAQSHVVCGVHGSHMLLPSGHAGATVEWVPPNRWGNLVQDVLIRGTDVRDTLMRHRFIPASTPEKEIAEVIGALITNLGESRFNFGQPSVDHLQLSAAPMELLQSRLRFDPPVR
jgi:hypothetical protein